MRFHCAALLLGVLPAFAWAQDEKPAPPEFTAGQKARKLYQYYLDAMMPSPDIYGHHLTFRISNDLLTGGDGKTPEFYLMAPLQRDRVRIRYAEGTSIYSALAQYLLENPNVTLDQLSYWPATIHKEFTYDQCPELKTRISAVEQYIRTSLFTSTQSRHSGLLYRVAYAHDDYELTYTVSNEKFRPVADLLEIRDLVMRCARNLPTVEEVKKTEVLESERVQAEYVKNFKGPLIYAAPSIVAKIGEKKFESALGTYCWGIGKDVLCCDAFAWVTSSTPIVVRRGDRISLEIPVRDWLESMEFSITRVTKKNIGKEEAEQQSPEYIFWHVDTHERPMTGKQLDSIVIDKPPGEYILTLHGEWTEYGDAMHGFYLKVVQ